MSDKAKRPGEAPRTGKVVLKKRRKRIEPPDIAELLLTCPGGAEKTVQRELADAGFSEFTLGPGAVRTRVGRSAAAQSATGQDAVERVNREIRCASRVLVPLLHFNADGYDEVYRQAAAFPWETLVGPEHTFMISSATRSDVLKDHRFLAMRLKDAVADRQRKYCGGLRSSVEKKTPHLIISVFASGSTVDISLDSTGRPLHERGYRLEAGDAPLRETVAAMMLLESGYRRGDRRPVLDPFCGSGTILIEAALIRSGRGPGTLGRSFAWQRWPWVTTGGSNGKSSNDKSRPGTSGGAGPPLVGVDLDADSIAKARRNAERAGVADLIRFEIGDGPDGIGRWAETRWAGKGRGIIVTNPPYGVRLQQSDLSDVYVRLGDTLRAHAGGWDVTVLAGDVGLLDRMRLRPEQRLDTYNGALPCSLNRFRIFERGRTGR